MTSPPSGSNERTPSADDWLAVDTETTGVAFYDTPFLLSYADRDGSGYVDLRDSEGVERARALLGQGLPLVFHNAKFDLQKLQLAGVLERSDRPTFHDTEGLAHLLRPGETKGLKVLVPKILGVAGGWDDELKSYCRKKKNGIDFKRDGYSKVPREILVPYALKDAEYTYQLFLSLWPAVQRDDGLSRLYELERSLTWALLDMEWAGLGVDLEYAEREAKALGSRMLKAELRTKDLAGEDFNPRSNPQIQDYFRSKGFRKKKYDKHTLPLIDDPMAQAILDLRGPAKMRDYLAAIGEEQRDGILHPNYRQYVPATGRMSSGKAER